MGWRAAAEAIRATSELDLPTEATIRMATNAARQLSRWAARDNVPEAKAAPVIMTAVKDLHHILRVAESLRAPATSQVVLDEMRVALNGLRSFFIDDYDSMNSEELKAILELGVLPDSSKEKDGGSKRQSALRELQPDEDRVACEQTAAFHLRLLFLGVVLIVLGFLILLVCVGVHQYLGLRERTRVKEADDLMIGAAVAADNVYVALWQTVVDPNRSFTDVARQLLVDASLAFTFVNSSQSIFYPSNYPLLEFRGAVQDFQHDMVVRSVISPRLYARLCRQNVTYPVQQKNDVGTNTLGVFPELTPYQCANDATQDGIFSQVLSNIRRGFPYVQNYRRDPALRVVMYNYGYEITFALTVDHQNIQDTVVPPTTLFGLQNVLRIYYGQWLTRAIRWVIVLLIMACCVLLVVVELLTVCEFRGSRIMFAVLFGAIVATVLAVTMTVIERGATDDLTDVLLTCRSLFARTVASYYKSPLMIDSGAVSLFCDELFTFSSGVFMMSTEDGSVKPSAMNSIAQQLDLTSFTRFNGAMHNGVHGGYVYAAVRIASQQSYFVSVRRAPERFHIASAVWVILGGFVTSSLYVLAYLYLSPLSRTVSYGTGSPLLRHNVPAHQLRFVYYVVLTAATLACMIGFNAYGTVLMRDILTTSAKETMMLLGTTQRTPDIAKYVVGARNLPSSIYGLYVSSSQNRIGSLAYTTNVDYAFPSGSDNWVGRYYGAQLALSHIFTVVENALSYSTPLLNTVSLSVMQDKLLRRMLASVDVNSSLGFVMERFPASHDAHEYKLTAQWVGVCICVATAGLVIALLEHLYIHLWRGRHIGQKRRLHWHFVALGALLLLLPCCIIVQHVIMHAYAVQYLTRFARDEMSTVLSAYVDIAGDALLLHQVQDGVPFTVDMVLDALSSVTLSVLNATDVYMGWYLLLDDVCDDCHLLRIIKPDTRDISVTHDFGVKRDAQIPMCSTMDGSIIEGILKEKIFCCFQELIVAAPVGRKYDRKMYIMVTRRKEELIDNVVHSLWHDTTSFGVLIAFILLVFVFLLTWWVMHTAHKTDFALLGSRDLELFKDRKYRSITSLDDRIPRRYRLWWCVWTFALSLIVLLTGTPFSVQFAEITRARAVNIVYTSQSSALSQFMTNLTNDINSFIYFSNRSVICGQINTLLNSAEQQNFYKFANANYLDGIIDNARSLVDRISGFNQLESENLLSLVPYSYGTFYTLRAVTYESLITQQEQYLVLTYQLKNLLPILVQANKAQIDVEKLLDIIDHIVTLRDMMRKKYVIDHMALIASIDVSDNDDANVYWPFQYQYGKWLPDLVSGTKAAYTYFANNVSNQTNVLQELCSKAFEESTVRDVFMSLLKEFNAGGVPCFLNDDTMEIYGVFRSLLKEYYYMNNKTASQIIEDEMVTFKKVTEKAVNEIKQYINSEKSMRFYEDMAESIRTGRSLQDERGLAGWERQSGLDRAKMQALYVFIGSITAYVLLLLALSGCFCAMQNMAIAIEEKQAQGDLTRKATKMGESCTETTHQAHDRSFDTHDSTSASHTAPEINKQISLDKGSKALVLHRRRVRTYRTVTLLALFGVLALIPFCCAYWMLVCASDEARRTADLSSMGLYVIKLREEFENTLLKVFSTLFSVYAADGSIESYLDQVSSLGTRLTQAVLWRLHHDPRSQSCFSSSATPCEIVLKSNQFTQLMSEFKNVVTDESSVYKAAFTKQDQWTNIDARSTYPLNVLHDMQASDGYSRIIPMALTSTGPAQSIFHALRNNGLANMTGKSNADLLEPLKLYFQKLEILSGVADADLQLWHTVVAATREDGADTAVRYSGFISRVNPDTFETLQETGVSKDDIDALKNYYAPILKIAGSVDVIRSIFTDKDVPVPSDLNQMIAAYLAAAEYSRKSSPKLTKQNFREVFVYNRRLLNFKQPPRTSTPLVDLVDSLAQLSRDFVISRNTPATFVYDVVPATKNKWVWLTMIRAHTMVEDVLLSSESQSAMVLCIILSFITAISVAFIILWSLH